MPFCWFCHGAAHFMYYLHSLPSFTPHILYINSLCRVCSLTGMDIIIRMDLAITGTDL